MGHTRFDSPRFDSWMIGSTQKRLTFFLEKLALKRDKIIIVINDNIYKFFCLFETVHRRFDLLYGSIVPSRQTFREKKVRFFVTTEPFKGSIVPK